MIGHQNIQGKLTELKGSLDRPTIQMGDFSMFLLMTESRHADICMDIEHWKNMINKFDIIDIGMLYLMCLPKLTIF